MSGRVIVAIVALAAIFWLGAMERNERLVARGVAASGNLRVAGNEHRAETALRQARFLNPDSGPDLARAFMRSGARHPEDAARLAHEIVRREPANILAWGLLVRVSVHRDPPTFRRASAALRRLDPLTFGRAQ